MLSRVIAYSAGAAVTAATDPDLGFNLLLSGPGAGEVLRQRLEVDGEIPAWLDGLLLQNGGGRFEWPESGRQLTNAGDGYAKLDVLTFRNGTVEYTSKFARSAWWNQSVAKEDIAPSLTFGVPRPPRRSDYLGLPNIVAANDNLAVNIMAIGGQIQMLSDRPGTMSFDPETLEFGYASSPFPVIGNFSDEPPVPKGMSAMFGSAHPLYTGSSLDCSGDLYGLVNVQRYVAADPRREQVRLFHLSAEEQRQPKAWFTRRAVTIVNQSKGEYSPYMHSFILAGRRNSSVTHAVLVEHAMDIAMANIVSGLGLKPISAGFDIDLSRPMKFHVVRLESGVLEKEISVPMSQFVGTKFNSFIVSHTINGYYDDDGHLVLDVIGYDFLFFQRFEIDLFTNKNERDTGPFAGKGARTFRFVLDVAKGEAVKVEELLPNSDWEFPTINEAFKGKPYCYTYGYAFAHNVSAAEGATGFANMAVIKYNVCGGLSAGAPARREHVAFQRPFHYFMEPWFVPRPGSSEEDDGLVLALALDGARGKGVLHVLDARDMRPVATVQLPQLVNLKTHGRFLWSRALKKRAPVPQPQSHRPFAGLFV